MATRSKHFFISTILCVRGSNLIPNAFTYFRSMQVSIWEKESFYADKDVIIIGSGFTGLWSAYELLKKNEKLKIAILERGVIPEGASTRNAGFSCFGSPTEL